MDSYVAGFMFSRDFKRVALIRKQKPHWQKNKLNGIGGKVEPGESALDAMVREFQEETDLLMFGWRMFAGLSDESSFRVSFFVAAGDLSLLGNPEFEKTGEKVEIVQVAQLQSEDTIENLPWLIPLAIDVLQDGRPDFVSANYPQAAA